MVKSDDSKMRRGNASDSVKALGVSGRDGDGAFQPFGLTSEDLKIVALVANGHTNKEIAEALSLTEYKVGRCIADISKKLGVLNKLELVFFAVSHQLTGAVPPNA